MAPMRSVWGVVICTSSRVKPRSRAMRHQCNQRDLRAIGNAIEHRLRRKQAPHRQTVNTPCERVAHPCLDAVSMAQPMHLDVGREHFGRHPGAAIAVFAAGQHHLIEASIDGDAELARTDGAGESSRNVQSAVGHFGLGLEFDYARGSGDHQRMGSSSLNQGKTPSA